MKSLFCLLPFICLGCVTQPKPMTLERAVQTLDQAGLPEDGSLETKVATELAQNRSLPAADIVRAFVSQDTPRHAVPALGICLSMRGFDFRAIDWKTVLPRLHPRLTKDRARVIRFVDCDEGYVLSVLTAYLKGPGDEGSKALVTRLAIGYHKGLSSKLAKAGYGAFVKRLPEILRSNTNP